MSLNIEYFNPQNELEWDDFVLNKSMNGTFLQTRKFINYHACGKFTDCSLCVRKGKELVATILACEITDGGKVFFAHKGSTYGGICVSSKIYTAALIGEMMQNILGFLRGEGFGKIYFKMVPNIYQRKNTDLLDYFMYKEGFYNYSELNYYMSLERYKDDVLAQFSSSKRRDYRYSLRNNLVFKRLDTVDGISTFFDVLQLNLKKLGLSSVHSLDDLKDLKFNRFEEQIEFYGVYLEDCMIAGSMVFLFENQVFHTQYLCSNEEYLKLFPMDFLIGNLIQRAVDKQMKYFSFGICTEDQGRYLNLGLSRFKEGFGAEFCINHSYEKCLEEK